MTDAHPPLETLDLDYAPSAIGVLGYEPGEPRGWRQSVQQSAGQAT